MESPTSGATFLALLIAGERLTIMTTTTASRVLLKLDVLSVFPPVRRTLADAD